MRAQECVKFSAISETTAAFELKGGVYVLAAAATWGEGNAVIDRQLANGSYVPTHTALAANGITPPLYLPPGQYRLTITTATALSGDISRVPFE